MGCLPEVRALEPHSDRRALGSDRGELYLLEAAWKEAEEIAGISDDLLLPGEISTKLGELKRDVK